MQTLTEIVVQVAREFRDECFPGEWGKMPVHASWGRISWFRYKLRGGNVVPGMDTTSTHFGAKCVEWNAANPTEGRLFSEISRLRMVDRLCSPAGLLASLICHEFSHAWIHYMGLRRPNHVHDAVFYERMGWMLNKWGEKLANRIAELGGAHLLDVSEHVKVQRAALSEAPVGERISRGDNVFFFYQGNKIRGVVVESRGRGRVTVAVGSELALFRVVRDGLIKI
jgi:hypothetical protein